ncbi:hypothetical protein ACTXT7_005741 [Hymenolepis weldensis]
MCEITNLIVTPGPLPINIVCPQVAHPHRSEKLSVPRMIVAEAQLTQRCFEISSVHTFPSISYNPPVQLKHIYNYVFTRVLIQLTNINSLSLHTTHTHRLSLVGHIFLRYLPQFSCTLLDVSIEPHTLTAVGQSQNQFHRFD